MATCRCASDRDAVQRLLYMTIATRATAASIHPFERVLLHAHVTESGPELHALFLLTEPCILATPIHADVYVLQIPAEHPRPVICQACAHLLVKVLHNRHAPNFCGACCMTSATVSRGHRDHQKYSSCSSMPTARALIPTDRTHRLAVRRCSAAEIAVIARSPLPQVYRLAGSLQPGRLRRGPGNGPRARVRRSAQDGARGRHARRLGRLQPAQPEGMPARRTLDTASAAGTGRGGGPADAAHHLHAGPGRGARPCGPPRSLPPTFACQGTSQLHGEGFG